MVPKLPVTLLCFHTLHNNDICLICLYGKIHLLSWQLYKFRLEQFTTVHSLGPMAQDFKKHCSVLFSFTRLSEKTSAVWCVVRLFQYMRLLHVCVHTWERQMESVVLYWAHCDSLPDWHHMADCFVVWLQQSAINSAPNPHCHHSSWQQFSLLYLLQFLHKIGNRDTTRK